MDISYMINKFLTELEAIAMKEEAKKEEKETENRDYEYIEGLINAISTNTLAFAKMASTIKGKREERFIRVLHKVISDETELEDTLEEIHNLYYLKEANLIGREEVSEQQTKSQAAINALLAKLKVYLRKINFSQNEKEIKSVTTYLEKIVNLGNKFSNNGLKEIIDDIDFLYTIINKTSLSYKEVNDFLAYILQRNCALYQMQLLLAEKRRNALKKPKRIVTSAIETTTTAVDDILANSFTNMQEKTTKKKESNAYRI